MASKKSTLTARLVWLTSDAAHRPIINQTEACGVVLRGLCDWAGRDQPALRRQLAELADGLEAALQSHRELVWKAEELESGWIQKMFGGVDRDPLTRDEFYLVRAMGGIDVDGDPEYAAYLSDRTKGAPSQREPQPS